MIAFAECGGGHRLGQTAHLGWVRLDQVDVDRHDLARQLCREPVDVDPLCGLELTLGGVGELAEPALL